jgi:hypothetical protein
MTKAVISTVIRLSWFYVYKISTTKWYYKRYAKSRLKITNWGVRKFFWLNSCMNNQWLNLTNLHMRIRKERTAFIRKRNQRDKMFNLICFTAGMFSGPGVEDKWGGPGKPPHVKVLILLSVFISSNSRFHDGHNPSSDHNLHGRAYSLVRISLPWSHNSDAPNQDCVEAWLPRSDPRRIPGDKR